jgi:hypothetical protein
LNRPELPNDLVGIDRLLNDLASYPGNELAGVVLVSSSKQVYTIFLDKAAERLVACYVAPDRREEGDSPLHEW